MVGLRSKFDSNNDKCAMYAEGDNSVRGNTHNGRASQAAGGARDGTGMRVLHQKGQGDDIGGWGWPKIHRRARVASTDAAAPHRGPDHTHMRTALGAAPRTLV